MSTTNDDRSVLAVRAFNRFWTAQIGVLNATHLGTPHSLAEARVLFELAQAETTSVGDLRRRLGLDAGYLSRILRRFAAAGLVAIATSAADGRRQNARLTKKGRRAFADLDARSAEVARATLAPLAAGARRRLVGALREIEALFGPGPAARSYVLRPPRAGELGWIVQRHGALYAEEYGWAAEFEAAVAQIVADYGANRDSRREAAFIAELDGEPIGSVLCLKKTETVAQLRLLLVEPRARGLGIGGRLVEECIRFARQAGYRRMTLWTNGVLHAARRVYEKAGFSLERRYKHHSFGHDLEGQHWGLRLAPGPAR